MNWFFITLCFAVIGYMCFLLIRLKKTENKLRIAKEVIERQDAILESLQSVKAAYMETVSDIIAEPDREKRKKIIRHKLYNQIAQKISKNFDHKMDMERSESGRIIYSYKFLIKRT